MDSLYTSLRNEIGTFEKHVQSCRDSFDLVTLSRFLSALTEHDPESVDNLQRVRQLASCRGGNKLAGQGGSSDIDGYVSWLSAYVDYLRVLKETFDDKVVIPLCENLYVNEETDSLGVASDSSNLSSSTSSQASFHRQRTWGSERPQAARHEVPSDSIPKVAKELFNVRRRWALLLTNDTIKVEYFNPQSIAELHKVHTPKHLSKVLRLIPDIFYKGLLAADLSSQWVDLHECRHCALDSAVPVTKGFYNDYGHTTSKVLTLRETELSMDKEDKGEGSSNDLQLLRATSHQSSEEIDAFHCKKTKPRVRQQELEVLLRAEARVKELQRQTRFSGLRIHELRSQLEQAKKETEVIHQRRDFEATGNTEEGMISGRHWTTLRQIWELERQLTLEKYQHKILQGDWLLELEIRPSVIRHMDMLNAESETYPTPETEENQLENRY